MSDQPMCLIPTCLRTRQPFQILCADHWEALDAASAASVWRVWNSGIPTEYEAGQRAAHLAYLRLRAAGIVP